MTKLKSIIHIAREHGNFQTLIEAFKAARLAHTFETRGLYTIFAPTDDAFAELPRGSVEALLKDREKLTAVLTYHVVAAKVLSSDVIATGYAKHATVHGQKLHVQSWQGSVYVNSAKVTGADIIASNGVMHVIDKVLMPRHATVHS